MHRPTLQPAFRQIAGRFLRAAWPACLLAAFLALPALPAHGQNSPAQSHPMLPQPLGQSVNDDGAAAADHEQAERLLRALNADRQKALVNDTNKLLRLVNELNAEIARTEPSVLTADQLRKLAEIEKLARNVKEKMATSVRGTQAFEPPFQPVHN